LGEQTLRRNDFAVGHFPFPAGESALGAGGCQAGLGALDDGPVECMRLLRASRSSAMKARTAAINQIKDLMVSAPEGIRTKYRGMVTSAMIMTMARSKPAGHLADPVHVTVWTLKKLARRYQSLTEEIAEADSALKEILDAYAPLLCDLPGVGVEVASQLLVTYGRQSRTRRQRSPVRGTGRCCTHSRFIGQNKPAQTKPRR
jgi:hypothetical protein